jgi:long-chain fatty acid adenylyltransferase FadD28
VKVLREPKKQGSSAEKAPGMLHTVKWQMTSAVSTSHILPMVNLTLLPQYSISMTTSGKGRRSARVEHYWQDALKRLDYSA